MANVDVSWWKYAQAYDLVCDHNPYYQDNLEHFTEWLETIDLNDDPRICEVGAGTGNFIRAAAAVHSNADFYHWDWNSTMNAIAQAKYSDSKIEVEIANNDIRSFPGDLPRQDVMMALNSLYTFPDVNHVVREVFSLLKPGGWFYTIDLGRPLDVGAWVLDLIGHNIKNIGYRKTLRLLFDSRFAITENRKIDITRDKGNYWTHSTIEFGELLSESGFIVHSIETCYRGTCDRAICQKPELAPS